MNSGNENQDSWVTSDGTDWWLRAEVYHEPRDNYHANCYLDIGRTPFTSEDEVSFVADKCNNHASSYYCQLDSVDVQPKEGSPTGCTCHRVALTGKYSAETLIRCSSCLDVSKSTQKNSCPSGTKIFSPASREDWKTFLESAGSLRSPNFIFDVTKPTNGCHNCDQYAMNSD